MRPSSSIFAGASSALQAKLLEVCAEKHDEARDETELRGPRKADLREFLEAALCELRRADHLEVHDAVCDGVDDEVRDEAEFLKPREAELEAVLRELRELSSL